MVEIAERSAADLEAERKQVELQIGQARGEAAAAAAAETENRLRGEYERRLKQTQDEVQQAIAGFRIERKDYFERVETEVVRLALAIAGKILHREAQVDSMMLAALVRVSVEKMDAGTRVTARVPSSEAEKWKTYFSEAGGEVSVEVVEDASLSAGDCVLETELGATDFSIDAQLKEVERGFFDLLAHRPGAE
jgi:flagellar assembly protein FliH